MKNKENILIKRFKDYGFKVGFLPCGKKNSIADVLGVRVGHFNKISGRDIRTGITIIDPGIKNLFRKKIPAAIYVGNGFGKLTGITQVEELGTLETPIALTNTLAVGPVMRGVVDWVIKNSPDIKPIETINTVVGETNDGWLNNIHKNSIGADDVFKAFKNLSTNTGAGCVGAGVGTRVFSWKGGIGSSSRLIKIGNKKYTLGALVQTNFGGALNILGLPIGKILGETDFDNFIKTGDGSCVVVLATDAPFSARQLKRIAKRAVLGLAKTGSVMAHGSGDYIIAFSTNRNGIEGEGDLSKCLLDADLTQFFLGAVEAVEESVYDALFAAKTTTGRGGNTLKSIPKDQVIEIIKNKNG
ncbi:MAG: P1 family peptidase [bacterium]|nr:P1 family peptidase [bacterium]